MRIEQCVYDSAAGWKSGAGDLAGTAAQLVLAFGNRSLLEAGLALERLKGLYPGAQIVAASTSGDIAGTNVSDNGVVATAFAFEQTKVACVATQIDNVAQSHAAGRELALQLNAPQLAHVFVFSDGQLVNGTDLAGGFNENLPVSVHLSGGLAGDGTLFARTVVGLDRPPKPGQIVAIGLYGSKLRVGAGCAGGWHDFGPLRLVTRAERNTLFELDGQSALRLYKKYLGDQAEQLPSSALRFPLNVKPAGSDHSVVRTILSIDEASESMTFAGDIPVGARVAFMRASYEDLIDGASRAAEQTLSAGRPQVAICVSCVGRRIVLGQRTEEELESVRTVVGEGPVLAGFYSYGELAPAQGSMACQLHNQTITITTLREED